MATFSANDLTQLGIQDCTRSHHNCSYEELFEREIDASQSGYDRGVVTALGAVAVDTGKFTGRSPRDKYIVKSKANQDNVWWADAGSDNKSINQKTWTHLKLISVEQLSAKQLFVMDGFCGANAETRLSVRLVTEVAWMAHFFKNMFIRPTEEELAAFKPDWTILNACKATCEDFASFDLNSENYVAFNLEERMTVIGGTWYGGEIKKGIFSIMNYFLPLKGIGSFHCSANVGANGDTALFFGLSGTGKTTLSTDPKRQLIGDDEHGWDDDGVFNLEGGCYAKTIDLTRDKEPDIYDAIKRNALLENVVVDESGTVDFESSAKTQNTRVSYPIYHIENIVKPVSKGTHPKQVIFLTCDAYGVLPPVSKLSKEQAMYQFLSGYTAKVAGTELGVKEPVATFSACFGQPFLLQHPTRYAEILGKKMEQHGSEAYLVNTGWTGGQYGVGKRTDLKATRKIIDSILNGTLAKAHFEVFPVFNLQIPTSIEGVDPLILNPRNTWADKEAYDRTLNQLAQQFIDNFKKFTNTAEGKLLEEQFHAGLMAA